MAKYGFGSVNKTFNKSNNFALNNAFKNSTLNITAGRVVSIILESDDPTKIGTISYVDYSSVPKDVSKINENQILKTAQPLFSNISNYPVINELVTIIIQPDIGIQSSTDSKSGFYINSINMYNHPHHNAVPYVEGDNSPSMVKNYEQVFLGNTKKLTPTQPNIRLGKTFKEKDNIHPLQPFEGDFIYQGRWGQSIRLGSTVKSPKNNWSEAGSEGDPITIIRNGQGPQSDDGSVLISENINNDDSSIYLTSTQNIPISVSSPNYYSYKENPPLEPNLFQGKQIIINSGRLVFNTTTDHLLLSSAKSINLSSISSINLDTPDLIIQSQKTYLGSKNATEPLLLGNRTVDLLDTFFEGLKEFLKTCSTLQVPNAPGALTPLNLQADLLAQNVSVLQGNLKTITSNTNYTI